MLETIPLGLSAMTIPVSLPFLIPFLPVTEKNRKAMPPLKADCGHQWERFTRAETSFRETLLSTFGSEPKCASSLKSTPSPSLTWEEDTCKGQAALPAS